jgi:hypothetical protein
MMMVPTLRRRPDLTRDSLRSEAHASELASRPTGKLARHYYNVRDTPSSPNLPKPWLSLALVDLG